ncbi:hypothetical protein CCMA1212_010206 [Trichoderma ghanense]|uniref:Uncharacterized protein n=1 Tax=Trichoderma ghanense TaxID=65468 RepID=A0ABY2GQQ8_9HYPO
MTLPANASAYVLPIFNAFTKKYCINAPLSEEPVATCMRAMHIDRTSPFFSATWLLIIILLSWRSSNIKHNTIRLVLALLLYVVDLGLLIFIIDENDDLEQHRQVELPGGHGGDAEAVAAHAHAMLSGSITWWSWVVIHLNSCPGILWLTALPPFE